MMHAAHAARVRSVVDVAIVVVVMLAHGTHFVVGHARALADVDGYAAPLAPHFASARHRITSPIRASAAPCGKRGDCSTRATVDA
jgi:hypothetical protein